MHISSPENWIFFPSYPTNLLHLYFTSEISMQFFIYQMSSYGENKKESTHFNGLLPFKHGINNIFTRKKDHQ